MIAKILKSVSGFPGVNYNTNKIDKDKGELLKVANFGSLQALGRLRPQDYVNYLLMLSKLNTRVKKPQFHAVISAKGKSYDKGLLCAIAEKWLKEMGYGDQPYLVVFHKDTENNHVHIVTTRVNREGEKISSDYEKFRSVKCLNNVLGYSLGMQYSFSTPAQFYMVLESFGYPGKDCDLKGLEEKIMAHNTNKIRALEIRQLLEVVRLSEDFVSHIQSLYNLELVFHAAEGRAPYGYSIIDHATKSVFKGSEVMPLKELRSGDSPIMKNISVAELDTEKSTPPVYVGPVRIANDTDDEAVHGRNRRRKKKDPTHTR